MIRFLLGLTLFTFSSVHAAVIDTTTGGYSSVSPFGEPSTATFGQTITTDTMGGRLDYFSFYMTGLNENFMAYVYQWDGFKAVGNALYKSDVINIGNPGTEFKEVTFKANAMLPGSTQFVLFLSTSGFHDGFQNINRWGYVDDENAYSGGSFVYDSNGNSFEQLTMNSWDNHGNEGWGDLAFRVQISAVPEPSQGSSFWLGTMVVMGYLRKKFQNRLKP